jgi:glycosyltransferase involved in cell wall biosynthesis
MIRSVGRMTIDVVLPCLNEAAALPWVLPRMPAGFRPIVVDNGSVDGSPAIARELGATVITASTRGYGAACHAGVIAATSRLVCVMDADATLDPQELPHLVRPLLDGRADLVVGRRRATTPAAFPLHARVGNAALVWALRRRGVRTVHDIGPMRAAHRVQLLALDIRDRRFGYPLEIIVRATAAGFTIAERDVTYRPRIGRSKVTGTVRGTARAIRDMRKVLAS